MRVYKPGDQIFIFGFSRGAYSARVLAGMLYKVGLLSQGNEELIDFAWDMYKKQHDPEFYTGFRHTFSRKVDIKFLGLWDTVSSIGWAWNPQSLPFTRQNPSVEVVRHAVALDERRAFYLQNLWSENPQETEGQNVLQVWFPGVHCDVGGGYPEPEAGLSKISLKWMVAQVEQFGLRVHPKAKEAILPVQDTRQYLAANPTAPLHHSLHGLWWIVEYLPKRIKDASQGFAERWILHRGRYRIVPSNAHIHASVFERMDKFPEYRLTDIPTAYQLATS